MNGIQHLLHKRVLIYKILSVYEPKWKHVLRDACLCCVFICICVYFSLILCGKGTLSVLINKMVSSNSTHRPKQKCKI